MSVTSDLTDVPLLPRELIDAALDGQLVLFVGAGASMLVGLPSWVGLAKLAFDTLIANRVLNYAELEHLRSLNDPKMQLSIATLIAAEHELDLNLAEHLKNASGEDNSIYDYLNSIGATCVTTNYDELLSPIFLEAIDGSETPASVKRIIDPKNLHASHLKEPGTVVHLHGAISKPDSMIVTTKDYIDHYDHHSVQDFLAELFANKVVLFIGYGLNESEILEHILRRSGAAPEPERRRFALQGYFSDQQPLYTRIGEYYEKSFGVHLVGYLRDQQDYAQLANVVKDWAGQLEVRPPSLADDIAEMDRVLADE